MMLVIECAIGAHNRVPDFQRPAARLSRRRASLCAKAPVASSVAIAVVAKRVRIIMVSPRA
ncbi:MAG: hypothetical protein QM771_11340 [Nitrospira sp.]